jgi:hypothetical protein
MRTEKMTQTFEGWWKEVNSLVEKRIGLQADDMPDLVMVRDLYDEGLTPDECAEELFETWSEEGDIPPEFLL